MMSQKSETVDGLTKGIEFLFKKNKVDYVKGAGKILSAGKVEVTAADGTTSVIETKNIVIATGSEPATLPGVTIDEETVVSSTGALALKKVPGKLILIGAGVIGLELGSVWRRLGAKVEVVEYLDRILPGMDNEVAKTAQRIFTKQGMTFHLGKKVTGVTKGAKGLTLSMEPAAGGAAETLEADVVLVCIGRRPYTAGLGLENVGITPDRRGMIENHHFKTNAPGVWVIGDVTSGPMLAHKAEDEAVAVAEIIAGQRGHVNYDAIPAVVYTAPEVASVGKTEEELKAANIAYKVGKFPFSANSRARVNASTEGFAKVLADAKTDQVLGVHIIGPEAGNMIAEAALAIEFKAAAEDIARTSHAHPTLSEAVRGAAQAIGGWAMQM
jgi:dihydrolipoamide dehydrogenase